MQIVIEALVSFALCSAVLPRSPLHVGGPGQAPHHLSRSTYQRLLAQVLLVVAAFVAFAFVLAGVGALLVAVLP